MDIGKTTESLPAPLTSTPKTHMDNNQAPAAAAAAAANHIMILDPEVYTFLVDSSTTAKEAAVSCSGVCCVSNITLSPIPPQYYVVNSPPLMEMSSSSGRSTETSTPLAASPHILHEGPNSDKALECKLCNQHLAAIDMP